VLLLSYPLRNGTMLAGKYGCASSQLVDSLELLRSHEPAVIAVGNCIPTLLAREEPA
jgi:hypothetical protein